jgi:dienelactone hydrolase
MTPVPVPTVPALGALLFGPFRPCEWGLLLLVAGIWASGAVGLGIGSGARVGLALVLSALLILHGWGEGWRWQMAPVYLAALLALAWLGRPAWPRPLAWAGAVFGIGAGLATAVFAIVMPLFRLPPPGGPLAVGTRLYHLVDTARAEPHLAGGQARRELMVQVWYPAAPNTGHGAAAYRSDTNRLALSHQRLAATAARAEAVPAQSDHPRPVVLFAHAWRGSRSQNTALVQDLASRGFVVAAFDRPYNAGLVAFPNGRVVTAPVDMTLDLSDDRARLATLDRGAREATIGAADASAVLDALGRLGAGDPLAGQVAADRAIILGHSFGGAVAAEACRRDHRFVAALNLDGWLFATARDQGVPCLYLLMNDGESVPPDEQLTAPQAAVRAAARMQIEDRQAQERSFARYGGWDLTVAGASHEDFTDRVFYSPLRRLTGAGAAAPGRVDALVRIYAAALAQAAFGDGPATALEAPPADFPELRFRRWPSER